MWNSAKCIHRHQTPTSRKTLNDLAIARAYNDFYVYRQVMNPRMQTNWFTMDLAQHLQDFYIEHLAGKRPIMVICTPPQHGKSLNVIDLIAWMVGHDPHLKVIYTSFSDRLCLRANKRMQRSLHDPKYQIVFPDTAISQDKGSGYIRNTDILEFVATEGYFRNTTVGGPITGEELDLGIIDDPLKGRAEANSKIVREKIWSWLTDDMMTRFSEYASLLLINTRWHVDDPAGRLIEHFGDKVQVLKYPAFAEKNEDYRWKGEPLFPRHKSAEFLQTRKKLMTLGAWEALYQQNPIIVGGGIFPIENFKTISVMDRSMIQASVRAVDKAGTEDGGAYTAGVLMHKMKNGTFLIEDVDRGHWSALRREQRIREWAINDSRWCPNYEVVVEQEPGSGGKESAEATVRNLAGFRVYTDKVTGSKETRAEPFAAQVQGGNVWLVAGNWHYGFLDEAQSFPHGKYRDQIDAATAAFNRLTLGLMYDTSYDWAL